MPSRTKPVVLIAGVIIFSIAFVGGVSKVSSDYLDHASSQSNQGCSSHSVNYKVTIQNDEVSPAHTTAPRCDTLTITNLDDTDRLMAFGLHENHEPYDGVAERLLGPGQSFTVTLVQTGSFRFHDHAHDEVQGTFTVTASH
ncbi:MAG TPA: cupredoxin domain-containing protein [Patescibacteria group bacterium]|nr:cupredoxin domain-containing protein [Patescibacteria group bacterium]